MTGRQAPRAVPAEGPRLSPQATEAARLIVQRVPIRTLVNCFQTKAEHEAFALLLKETL